MAQLVGMKQGNQAVQAVAGQKQQLPPGAAVEVMVDLCDRCMKENEKAVNHPHYNQQVGFGKSS